MFCGDFSAAGGAFRLGSGMGIFYFSAKNVATGTTARKRVRERLPYETFA